MIDLGPLHFLRPEWLWALLALPVLALWLRRTGDAGADWRRAVDPHLLPFLLEPGRASRQRWLGWLAGLAYLIATVALAGPAWPGAALRAAYSRYQAAFAAALATWSKDAAAGGPDGPSVRE